ncbi:hypothetical protein E4U23_003737 [Claviceps purpurea]|nr:hypothetical protein E4U23_003737 [Claviceps purpurea]
MSMVRTDLGRLRRGAYGTEAASIALQPVNAFQQVLFMPVEDHEFKTFRFPEIRFSKLCSRLFICLGGVSTETPERADRRNGSA